MDWSGRGSIATWKIIWKTKLTARIWGTLKVEQRAHVPYLMFRHIRLDEEVIGLRPAWQEEHACVYSISLLEVQKLAAKTCCSEREPFRCINPVKQAGPFHLEYSPLCWWRTPSKFNPFASVQTWYHENQGILSCVHFSFFLGQPSLLLLKKIISSFLLLS